MAAQSFDDLFKVQPAANAAHHTTALGNERTGRKHRALPFRAFIGQAGRPAQDATAVGKSADWSISARVTKVDDEIGVIYGWASVIEEGGQVITDTQGDRIAEADLIKAAHEFMLQSRTGGLMHWSGENGPVQGGDVVESMVLSRDLQKALGIDLGKSGWLIAYRPLDPDVLAMAKAGQLPAFSIGGSGTRVPV